MGSCPEVGFDDMEDRAALHRAERIKAWRQPKPLRDAALLAASFLLCLALLTGLIG